MNDWGWICIGIGAFFFLAFFYKGLVTRYRAKHPVKLDGLQTVETDPEAITLTDPYKQHAKPAPKTETKPAAPDTAKPAAALSAFHRAFYDSNADTDTSTPNEPYKWA